MINAITYEFKQIRNKVLKVLNQSSEQGVDAQAPEYDGDYQDVVEGERVAERGKRRSLETRKKLVD